MQLEFIVEAGARHEPLEFGDAHLLHVLENHVIRDGTDNGLRVRIAETKALQNCPGHLRAEFVMSVESNAPRFVHGLSAGFSDVVKQYSEYERQAQRFVRQQAEHCTCVDEYVAFGMKLGRLFASFERCDFGQDFRHQPAFHKQVETAQPGGSRKNPDKFLADTLGAYFLDVGCMLTDRQPRRGFDFESKIRAEPNSAEQT